MSSPETVIAALKRALEAQSETIVSLREDMQTAQAEAATWQAEAEGWEMDSKAAVRDRASYVLIPWRVFDELVRALENGNASHALRLLNREAVS